MQTSNEMQAAKSEFLTADEVGKRLRIGREKVMNLVDSGQLKALRLGRRCVRIRADSVEQLVEGALP